MATTVKELREWLDGMPDNDNIGIDDGGLTLVQFGADAGTEERRNAWYDPSTASSYFEVGGIAFDEEDDHAN